MLDRRESDKKNNFNIHFVFMWNIIIIFLPINSLEMKDILMSIKHVVAYVMFFINEIDDIMINIIICFIFRIMEILM